VRFGGAEETLDVDDVRDRDLRSLP